MKLSIFNLYKLPLSCVIIGPKRKLTIVVLLFFLIKGDVVRVSKLCCCEPPTTESLHTILSKTGSNNDRCRMDQLLDKLSLISATNIFGKISTLKQRIHNTSEAF